MSHDMRLKGSKSSRVYGHGRKCECGECQERKQAWKEGRLTPAALMPAALTPAQLGCRVIMAGGQLVYRQVEAEPLRYTEPETC